MLFPKADIDGLIQIADMFRIDASKSFKTNNEELTEFNIYPDFDNSPLTVFNVLSDCDEDHYLDWAYETAGDYTVKIEMKTLSETSEKTYLIEAISEEDDNLLSNDSMIYSYESELKKYLPFGRNSWKYLHRKAQEEILDYFYRNAILNPDNTKIEKSQLIGDKLDKWSTFETILLIYQDIKTSNAEAFNEKIVDYSMKRNEARKRYLISYDSNKDGIITDEDVPRTTRVTYFSR